MINKVILIGNLGRDPEVKHLESGATVAKFSIATNENYKDKAGEWQTITQWHDIVCWRGLADRAEKSLKKGSLAFIEGKLTHRKWQDQNGNDRYSTEVVAQVLRPLEKRENSGGGSFGGSFPTANDELPTTTTPKPNPAPDSGNKFAGEEDDLPF
jgi:single-strand DNA-binding protein